MSRPAVPALVLALALSLSLVLALAASAADMGARVATACSGCHGVDRVCRQLGGNQAYWQETVGRMADHGAQVAPGEVAPMAAYLAGLGKAKAPFCK